MRYCEDFEMYYDFKIHAFSNVKGGEIYDFDICVVGDTAEEAQLTFNNYIKSGYGNYEGLELTQYWYKQKNGEWLENEVIERKLFNSVKKI